MINGKESASDDTFDDCRILFADNLIRSWYCNLFNLLFLQTLGNDYGKCVHI